VFGVVIKLLVVYVELALPR